LDCRRANMRLCTNAENRRNQRPLDRGASKYKGVSITKKNTGKKWHASISVSDRIVHLGTFCTEEEAARSYNAAALVHYGEFANLNTIEGLTYEESIVAPAYSGKPGRPSRSELASRDAESRLAA
jgi:hypothetical protein